jgi:hypothetical protein
MRYLLAGKDPAPCTAHQLASLTQYPLTSKQVLDLDAADMIHIQRISVEVMLPLENVIQWQLPLMKSKVYNLAMWVGGIPSGFPSILTHDIMIDSRYLKRSPHVALMDMLFELLHDLQI